MDFLSQVANNIDQATAQPKPDLKSEFGRVWFTANGDLQIRCKTPEEARKIAEALRVAWRTAWRKSRKTRQ